MIVPTYDAYLIDLKGKTRVFCINTYSKSYHWGKVEFSNSSIGWTDLAKRINEAKNKKIEIHYLNVSKKVIQGITYNCLPWDGALKMAYDIVPTIQTSLTL